MKKYLLITAILFSVTSHAQKDTPVKLLHIDNKKLRRQIDSSMKELDSINARINEGYKQTMHTMDSINRHLEEERNKRSLDAFLEMQQERQAKEKKAMWIRLGLGILFLGVLIFGMMRRKKKT